MNRFNIISSIHDKITDTLDIDGIKVELYDGEKIFQRYGKFYSEINGKVIQIEEDFYNYLWNKLDSFNYWEKESGSIMELNQMSSNHLSRTVDYLKRSKINPEGIIPKMEAILRDRKIDNILEDPTEENYGLDIE